MTVYVDETRKYPRLAIQSRARRHGVLWCHMFSDNPDKSELHTIARRIGHKRAWFQDQHKKYHWMHHYDLVPTRRELAIRAGAVEIDLKDLIRRELKNEKIM